MEGTVVAKWSGTMGGGDKAWSALAEAMERFGMSIEMVLIDPLADTVTVQLARQRSGDGEARPKAMTLPGFLRDAHMHAAHMDQTLRAQFRAPGHMIPQINLYVGPLGIEVQGRWSDLYGEEDGRRHLVHVRWDELFEPEKGLMRRAVLSVGADMMAEYLTEDEHAEWLAEVTHD